MNNITKYLLIFILLVAIIFGGYYYFKFQSIRNKELEAIEEREKERGKDIDSILEVIKKNIKTMDSLTEVIKKLENYEIPETDNTDIIPRDIKYKDSLFTSYYPSN